MMALTACTTQSGPDYTVWIPDHSISDLELGDDTITTQSSRVIPSQEEYTSVDEIVKKMEFLRSVRLSMFLRAKEMT